MKRGEMGLIASRLSDHDWMQQKVNDRIEVVDGCWLWGGGTIRGYGQVYVGEIDRKSVTWYTHRLMFVMNGGVLVRGMHLDHLCRTPLCCNPDHLEQVTPDENSYRAGQAVKKCVHGHAYTPENTVYRDKERKRRRYCRTCYLAYQRELRERKKVAA